MAGTRISDGIPTTITGIENVPIGTGSGKTTTTTRKIAQLSATLVMNTQTASYTLVLADSTSSTEVNMNVAGANNLTVPPNSSVAFPIGTQILIRQIGAGLTTFVQGSGVTITPTSGSLTMAGQNYSGLLIKTGTDTWTLDNGSPALVSSDITTALGYTPWAVSGTTTLSASSPPVVTQTIANSGATPLLIFTGAAHTLQTAAALTDITYDMSSTLQFTGSTGFTNQPTIWIKPRTYAFQTATGTITNGYTLLIAGGTATSLSTGAPIAGTNTAITNKYALGVFTTSTSFNVSNSLTTFSKFGGTGLVIQNGSLVLTNSSADPALTNTVQVGTVQNLTNVTAQPGNNLIISSNSWSPSSGTGTAITLGNGGVFGGSGTFAPTFVSMGGSLNNTGSGNSIGLNLGWQVTAAPANFTAIDYNPTIVTITGVHYGILIRPSSINGFAAGATPANAYVVIGAGTTTLAPFKLTSGINLTTAVAGCMEYDGTTLFFTRTGTTRESILTGIANVVSPTSPNRTIQVVVSGTTLYIAAKTTND